jgi:hypothetical protein
MDVDKTVGVFDLVVDLASIINSLIPWQWRITKIKHVSNVPMKWLYMQ